MGKETIGFHRPLAGHEMLLMCANHTAALCLLACTFFPCFLQLSITKYQILHLTRYLVDIGTFCSRAKYPFHLHWLVQFILKDSKDGYNIYLIFLQYHHRVWKPAVSGSITDYTVGTTPLWNQRVVPELERLEASGISHRYSHDWSEGCESCSVYWFTVMNCICPSLPIGKYGMICRRHF